MKMIHEKYERVVDRIEQTQAKLSAKWKCRVCDYVYVHRRGLAVAPEAMRHPLRMLVNTCGFGGNYKQNSIRNIGLMLLF